MFRGCSNYCNKNIDKGEIMEVQFLGTGAGLPSKYRNTQSIVFNFMQELKECWMFDCGEATQHKMLHSNIKPGKISRIFISHMHGDHVLGLPGFLSSRNFLLNEKKQKLVIYGPKGIKEFINKNLEMIYSTLNYDIEFFEIFNDEETILEDNKYVKVSYFPLQHTIPSYGFKIEFKNQKGSLNVEKLKEIDMLPGPMYRIIKEQDQFEYNGVIYNSSDFLLEEKKGKKIAIISDTRYYDDINSFLKDCDILISECTYLKEEEEDLAYKHRHMNIKDIYKLQEENKFSKIFLMHISSRYDKETIIKLKQDNMLENIIISKDLDKYIL